MNNRKNLTIAILMNHNFAEYITELIQGFYAAAKEESVNLIFLMHATLPRNTNTTLFDVTGEDFVVNFSSIYDYVPLIKPDVLIIAYGCLSNLPHAPALDDLLSFFEGVPTLLLEDFSTQYDYPHLTADNYNSMCECIQHLITVHGYKKIAFLNGPEGNNDSDERFLAYCDTMRKNGLTVTDTMHVRGDFSMVVEEQVNYLLDANPGLEAIACANDNMAIAAYRVCNMRGLIIGQDLAITGFDDIDYARKINPPLTSIRYSSFLLAYQGIKNAVLMYRGNLDSADTIPSFFRPRASCGCHSSDPLVIPGQVDTDKILLFIRKNVEEMGDDFFISSPHPDEKLHYQELLMNFFYGITQYITEENPERYTFNAQITYLKKLCDYPRISPMIMLEHLRQLFLKLIAYAPEENVRSTLQRILIFTQQYVYSHESQSMEMSEHLNKHQNWFAHSFTWDLITSDLSMDECLLRIMKRLQIMNIKSCYFFLRSEPIDYGLDSRLQLPDNLYLAAYCDGDTTVAYPRDAWVPVNTENSVTDIVCGDSIKHLTTYILLSGKTQYGFFLCDCELEDISFISACSMQLGSFFRFCNLNTNQLRIRNELEASVKLIKEQNSILNFVSEYDELTKLLNRRGFMEKTIRAVNENSGKNAYVLFADLDHLKEINDCFGHAAGDFALLSSANYLQNCLPENAIIARLSGDEFVAFILSDMPDFPEYTKQILKEYSNNFNQTSNMPYYIELSVGIYQTNCTSTASVTDLLHQSDTLMYNAKTHRRDSVKK